MKIKKTLALSTAQMSDAEFRAFVLGTLVASDTTEPGLPMAIPTPGVPPKSKKIPLPDPIPPELLEALEDTLREANIDSSAFWKKARGWADRNDKRYAGIRGWTFALKCAVRESWMWVPGVSIKASGQNYAERVRDDTFEAARRVFQASIDKDEELGRTREGNPADGSDPDVYRLRPSGR